MVIPKDEAYYYIFSHIMKQRLTSFSGLNAMHFTRKQKEAQRTTVTIRSKQYTMFYTEQKWSP